MLSIVQYTTITEKDMTPMKTLELESVPERSPELGKALIDAVKNKNLNTVRLLLSLLNENPNEFNINAAGEEQHTALHWAALGGSDTITELLLNAGADPDRETVNGKTALYFAAKAGHTLIAHLLLLHFANPHIASTINGHSPWEVATKNAQKKIVELLLHFGCGIGKCLPEQLLDINAKYCFSFGMEIIGATDIIQTSMFFSRTIFDLSQLQDYEEKLKILRSGKITAENTEELHDVLISRLTSGWLGLKKMKETSVIKAIKTMLMPPKTGASFLSLKEMLNELNYAIHLLPPHEGISFREALFTVPYAQLLPAIARIAIKNPRDEALKTLFRVCKFHSPEESLLNRLKMKMMSDPHFAKKAIQSKSDEDARTILATCGVSIPTINDTAIPSLGSSPVTAIRSSSPQSDSNANLTRFKLTEWGTELHNYIKALESNHYNKNKRLDISDLLMTLLLFGLSVYSVVKFAEGHRDAGLLNTWLLMLLVLITCMIIMRVGILISFTCRESQHSYRRPGQLTMMLLCYCSLSHFSTLFIRSQPIVYMTDENWASFAALYRLLKHMQTILLPNQCLELDNVIRTVERTDPPIKISLLINLISNDLNRLFSGNNAASLVSSGLSLSDNYRDIHFHPIPQNIHRLLPLPRSLEPNRNEAEGETAQ